MLKMGKKSKLKKTKETGSLSLDTVLKAGGQKDDLELLQDVEDEEETIDAKEDLDAQPIKRDELAAFIQELGISKYRSSTIVGDGEEKESAELKEETNEKTEEDAPEAAATEEDASKEETTDKKDKTKKKKKKNKFKVQEDEISSTTPEHTETVDYSAKYQPRPFLLLKPGGKWYENEFSKDPVSFEPAGDEAVNKLQTYAARLLQDDSALYKRQMEKAKKSDAAWMKTVLTSGTLSDRTAAMTLQVQEAPIHQLQSLDGLIAMVKRKGRREAHLALDSLKELFISELLPEDRKLKFFDQHPLKELEKLSSGNRDSRDQRLLLWYYEGKLKEKYAEFVSALKELSHDNIAATKKKVTSTAYELLMNKPEQEKVILTLLVNKLGDPDYKIASGVVHLLNKLVQHHPNMKFVVVLEVERMMYRPNMAVKAQYYAVCFLNQLVLSHSESELSSRLITIYFSFFKSFVKKGEVDSKMLSALLTGVNRAYPYAKADKEMIAEQMSTLYKVVHMVNFNTSVQALLLLYQVMDSNESVSDRFYQALYRKLVDVGLKTSPKQAMFLNLLYKSMVKDVSHRRVKAFIKRILQVCCQLSPSFICGALILLSEVQKAKPGFMSFKQDGQEDSDDDEEEHFSDAADPDSEPETDKVQSPINQSPDTTHISPQGSSAPSWLHRKNLPGSSRQEFYDPQHRNPLYCNADRECVFELSRLSHHYHPSVALFAQQLSQGKHISYTGDPLKDFTLIRFLDRFVYRNPKKNKKGKEQEGHKNRMTSRRGQGELKGVKSIPVNSEEYLEQREEQIPADEKFFYRFFSNQAAKTKKDAEHDEDSDAGSISDLDFDDYLDNYEKQYDMDGALEFDQDFAGDFAKSKSQKKGKKKKKRDEDEDSDMDDLDDDLSEEEINFSDDEDFQKEFEDFDEDIAVADEEAFDEEVAEGEQEPGFNEEDVDFSDNDNFYPGGGSKGKRSAEDTLAFSAPKKRKKGKGDDLTDVFAAADDFADLIEDNAASKVNTIGSNALSNKDNSDVKQLKWETDRERWMKGKKWQGRKGKSGFRKGKQGHKGKHTGKRKHRK